MTTCSVPLQPHSAFCFDRPDEWGKWKRRLEQFHLVSRISAEFEERQVSTLLYTLGEDAEDVLSSTEDNRKKCAEVMSKLDSFFYVRKNVICECAKFN